MNEELIESFQIEILKILKDDIKTADEHSKLGCEFLFHFTTIEQALETDHSSLRKIYFFTT